MFYRVAPKGEIWTHTRRQSGHKRPHKITSEDATRKKNTVFFLLIQTHSADNTITLLLQYMYHLTQF